MRNLKKFLALVMAMVMAFSLMLTASAANTAKDFDDADSITEAFIEATDVLTGMKVFQGDGDGFYPGRNINRAEVAALIYRLATGDVDDVRAGTYANYGNFTDVSESDWFAGYVGFCANAGYIKGRSATTFDPYASVTGYEALAMILRAIGYDKNGEFTGTTWETNVSALATQLGILTNIKTTHYGNTLYLASRRDVVAELLFQADAKVPMVVYTPAFGYQQTGMSGGVTSASTNPTLGEHIFGLTKSEEGVLLGNQQTGETKSVMGYASDNEEFPVTPVKKTIDNSNVNAVWQQDGVPFSAYLWEGKYNVVDATTIGTSGGNNKDANLGKNVTFTLTTGIDLIGHNLKLWYDNGKGVVSKSGRPVYAYFDEAELTDVVVLDVGDTTVVNTPTVSTTLGADAKAAGFKVTTSTKAVFNDSFSKFGQNTNYGDGVAQDGTTAINNSPVRAYKLISNSSDKSLDAVIALNIESSQITESNNVNRVPTIGVPVANFSGNVIADGPLYVLGNKGGSLPNGNLKGVGTTPVVTGVIAQDALVGNSTKTLGDYEFGIHITGTTNRAPLSANEIAAINGTATETAYFLLNKVEATVEGTVVAYNTTTGTVTLDNGTVLNRSKYYHTVVGYDTNNTTRATPPASKIPQAWDWDGTKWVESYANVGYKFYTDYEGKYLGAERSYGTSFLYGTYLDYSQETSSSAFKYFLTGVDMNGEIKTIPVEKYWRWATSDWALTNITGTNNLAVPFRDTVGGTGQMNGIGDGQYLGFAVSGTTVNYNKTDNVGNPRGEYLSNMARLGIANAGWNQATNAADTTTFGNVVIDRDSITLGAEQTNATTSRKYYTEATKFILVSGIGTDSVKAEVYNGISELRGTASSVTLDMSSTTDVKTIPHIAKNAAVAMRDMTYFTESPYTYAQSGSVDMKIDTIILPKAAVTWAGGSGLFYVGNPTPSLTNSWGTDAWKYDLYQDGELKQVWLTNQPGNGGTSTLADPYSDKRLEKDSFYNLKDTGKTANDGQPIYTAGHYDAASNNAWTAGNTVALNANPVAGTGVIKDNQFTMSHAASYATSVRYSAVTRDAQTATFIDNNGSDGTNKQLYRVAEAKVVNLNKDAKSNTTTLGNVDKCQSGEYWPGITDLATLNEAGSINPVTGRPLKVAAVVDPANPLVVTCIYVCWDQDFAD